METERRNGREGKPNEGGVWSISLPETRTESQEDYQDDEEASGDRQNWSNPIEFLLSCVSMSVGIGNFYRFPYVAYTNGGGAFLIPYLIVLFLVGKPIYFLELAVGQFCSFSQVKVWNSVPLFRGIGYGSTLASFFVVSYYVSVVALTVFYFFASFQSTLPWTVCYDEYTNCSDPNATRILAQVYFEKAVLNEKPEIESGLGALSWQLSLCYLFAWIAVFLSIVKGVASSGKVAYFTAIYPYIVLLILLVTGATKDGSWDGMYYFIKPQWEKLLEAKVWYAAVSQCFFSLSTGFGPIIMYASYNKFRHNVYRDAMIVSIIDTLTSFLAGLTVFSILGNLSFETGVEIGKVAASGPGLVFVSYADAIGKFEYVPQLFSVLFFLMLFALGVGSAVSWQMAVITVIMDEFPKLPKVLVTLASCLLCFAGGLVYVTQGGQHVLTLVDNFSGNFVIYILATLEIVGFAWVYGLFNLVKDFEYMLNVKISWYWKFCWGFFVPVFLSVVLVYSLVTLEPLEYEDVELPFSAMACGWTIAALCLGFVPLCAVYEVFWKAEGKTVYEKIKFCLKPNIDWGPKSQKERRNWVAYKQLS